MSRLPKKIVPFLNEVELEKILETAEKTNFKYFITMKFLAYTGIRVGELTKLTFDNFFLNETSPYIKFVGGRTEKRERLVLLHPILLDDLKKYFQLPKIRQRIKNGETIFPYTPRAVQKFVKKIALDAGINKKVTPHVFRHTFATLLRKEKVDWKVIQTMLGHKKLATTMDIYAGVDVSEMKEALEKFPVKK